MHLIFIAFEELIHALSLGLLFLFVRFLLVARRNHLCLVLLLPFEHFDFLLYHGFALLGVEMQFGERDDGVSVSKVHVLAQISKRGPSHHPLVCLRSDFVQLFVCLSEVVSKLFIGRFNSKSDTEVSLGVSEFVEVVAGCATSAQTLNMA